MRRSRASSAAREVALAAERDGQRSSREPHAPRCVELPSGLQYEVLREGDGGWQRPEDFVTPLRGTLVDGTSSTTRRSAVRRATFQVTA